MHQSAEITPELPVTQFVPSIPPKEEEKPIGLFSHRPRPAEALSMKLCREADRYMRRQLTYMAQRTADYEQLASDDPERLRFEYRKAILVDMYLVDNMGTSFFGELALKLQERNINFDRAQFQAAVWQLIDELGITS